MEFIVIIKFNLLLLNIINHYKQIYYENYLYDCLFKVTY